MTEKIETAEVKPRLHVNYAPDDYCPDLVMWFQFWWGSREMFRMMQDPRWAELTNEPPPPDQDWWQHLEYG